MSELEGKVERRRETPCIPPPPNSLTTHAQKEKMPKDLTPHQVSRGLTYVQKEAPFLAKLKQGSAEAARKNAKFENYVDGQDDDDYDELEGAQVVELDEHGRGRLVGWNINDIQRGDGQEMDKFLTINLV